MIIVYIIVIIIVIFLIFRMYLRIKHPFWSIQPVFHIYDIKKWMKPNQMIDKNIAIVNNYIDNLNINTKKVSNCNVQLLNRCVKIIQKYYLQSKYVKYYPTYDEFMKTFLDSLNSYISIYNEPKFILSESKTQQQIQTTDYNIIEDYKIKGIITARPIKIRLQNKKYKCYYIDNLCVHKEYRKQNIAPKLIQTHYYHLCQYTKQPNICLFKRENELTQIIPLTNYIVNGYSIKKIHKRENISKYQLDSNLKCIRIKKNKISLFIDFLNRINVNYECIIMPKMEHMIQYIENEYYMIYGLYDIYDNCLKTIHVFKNSNTNYKNEKVFECILSISLQEYNQSYEIENIVKGFINAIYKSSKEYSYDVLLIENIGYNNQLYKYLKGIDFITHLFKTIAGFYLYNFISHTIHSSKCFILI